MALKDLGFWLDGLRPLARLAVILRRLRASVSRPDSGVPVRAVLAGHTQANDPGDVRLC